MHVRMGWSGETSNNVWQKVDVELEEDDVYRLFAEHGLPNNLVHKLPVKVIYQLLQNEAEFLLLSKLKFLGYPVDKANARMAVLVGSTGEILDSIKNQLTPA